MTHPRQRKVIRTAILAIAILGLAFVLIPQFFWRTGLAPDPTLEEHCEPALGVTVCKPRTDDSVDWAWRAKGVSSDAGVFLQIRNAQLRAMIDFVYFPASKNETPATFIETMRSKSPQYRNARREPFTIAELQGIRETADYQSDAKNLKYITVVVKHRGRFLIVEASAPEGAIDALKTYLDRQLAGIRFQ